MIETSKKNERLLQKYFLQFIIISLLNGIILYSLALEKNCDIEYLINMPLFFGIRLFFGMCKINIARVIANKCITSETLDLFNIENQEDPFNDEFVTNRLAFYATFVIILTTVLSVFRDIEIFLT